MTSNRDAPDNTFFIGKATIIKRTANNIDHALDRFAEV